MKTQRAVAMRVTKLLLKNKLSVYMLAQKSGLTKQAISNIINEKYETVKFDTLIKLADGFNMSVIEFLSDPIFARDNLDV